MTKNRNRKLIRVTSSNQRPQQKCVDFRKCIKKYLTKFGSELKHQTSSIPDPANFTYSKNPRWRRRPYWI